MLKHATAALMAVFVCLVLSGCPKNAHVTGDARALTGVATATKTESVKHKICPDKMALDIKVNYPRKTGNSEVDAFFEKNAQDYIKNLIETNQDDVLAKDFSCNFPEHLFANNEFEASKPNPGVLGVLITSTAFLGGAHGSEDFKAYNFDLATGKEITIAELFPNGKEGISRYYDFLYLDLCSKTPDHDPANYVLDGKCGEDKKAPKTILNLTGSLDKLGHLILTETGATANFVSYEIWAGFRGPYHLKIPKEALLAMGARDFWNAPARSTGGE
ncbi:MAG: DUF4163 domain-containing protein [Deltaproteobacteria bacterium]|nr:DUF4163 domain-containing protein [Deltaproteobacteria bacterium]